MAEREIKFTHEIGDYNTDHRLNIEVKLPVMPTSDDYLVIKEAISNLAVLVNKYGTIKANTAKASK